MLCICAYKLIFFWLVLFSSSSQTLCLSDKVIYLGVSRGFSRTVDIFLRSMHENHGGKLIGLTLFTNIICYQVRCRFVFISLSASDEFSDGWLFYSVINVNDVKNTQKPVILREKKKFQKVNVFVCDDVKFWSLHFTLHSPINQNSINIIFFFRSEEKEKRKTHEFYAFIIYLFIEIVICFINSCVSNGFGPIPNKTRWFNKSIEKEEKKIIN